MAQETWGGANWGHVCFFLVNHLQNSLQRGKRGHTCAFCLALGLRHRPGHAVCTSILRRAFGEQIAPGCPTLPRTTALDHFPWKAFATRTLKSWKMRCLRGLQEKQNTPRPSTTTTPKQRNLIKELIQSTLVYRGRGGSFPLHTGGNREFTWAKWAGKREGEKGRGGGRKGGG